MGRNTHHSLAAVNAAIRALLGELNERPLQRQPHSRRALFERLDRPAMQALPAQPYVYAEWKYVRPGIDYHVELERRLYSVPHALVGHRLEARITATTVEVPRRSPPRRRSKARCPMRSIAAS